MSKEKTLGNRMKEYEAVPKLFLTLGTPKIIRLDMRAGHTFTKGFERPFDEVFSDCMIETTIELCNSIQGVVAGYTQSDEISLILNDKIKGGYGCFFDGNVEKIVSISASISTLEFNKAFFEKASKLEGTVYNKRLWKAQFDSRVFCLPNTTELYNYILWRKQDAERNSIQMVGHANFSDKQMHLKNTSQIQDMLMLEKGINWNNFKSRYKRGAIVFRELYTKKVDDNEVIRSRWAEQELPQTLTIEYIESIYNKED